MLRGTWPPFQALPAYYGGKRRLCNLIFGLLATRIPPPDWPGRTFLDPFLGAGSVSLFAKARGFHVIANDLALRSAATGRALIGNSAATLQPADVAALLRAPVGPYPRIAEAHYTPSVFGLAHAQLADRVLFNLNQQPEPDRSLATLLLVKWLLRVQPMSGLRGTDARAAFEGDLDRVSPRRLAHYLDSVRLLEPEAWFSLAREVNRGVFPGGGQAHQMDALEFLAGAQGDVVYLDPPYPGTTSYEREYAVLDHLLEGEEHATSQFSRSADLLPALFEACRHVPVLVISLNNAVLELHELEDMVRPHRPLVRSVEIPYRHLQSIASRRKNETNKEFIVIASA
jgi:16S rRNA G966 N2-methylase RsmD